MVGALSAALSTGQRWLGAADVDAQRRDAPLSASMEAAISVDRHGVEVLTRCWPIDSPRGIVSAVVLTATTRPSAGSDIER
jgi:hypothetical protein